MIVWEDYRDVRAGPPLLGYQGMLSYIYIGNDKMSISVIIVDDHPVISHGLTHVLGKNVDIDIVGIADNGVAALSLVKEVGPDVVILDISLQKLDGISLISQILTEKKSTKIIMYTMHNSKGYIIRSLRAGALGYVLKSDRTEELVNAVQKVVQGQVCLSSNISAAMMSEILVGNNSEVEVVSSLTPREYEVASLIAKSRSIEQIGSDLFISPKTVRVHRTNIMHKFGCKNVHDLLLQLRHHFPQ